MKNDTDSPREGTSSFIFVFLTLGDSAVYNLDRAGVTTCSFFIGSQNVHNAFYEPLAVRV